MKKCIHCHAELPDEAGFCDMCGEKLPAPAPVPTPVPMPVPTAAPAQKKSSKLPLILLGVAAAVLIATVSVVVIVLIIINAFTFNKPKNDSPPVDNTSNVTISLRSETDTTVTTTAPTVTTTTTTPTVSGETDIETVVYPQPDHFHDAIHYRAQADDGHVNVHSDAVLDSAVVGTLTNGTEFYATATNGNWVFLDDVDCDGWIHIDGLEIVTAAQTPDYAPVYPTSYLQYEMICQAHTYDGVNLRSGPSTDYSILDSIPQYDTIHVIAEKNGWYYGYYGSKSGWVSKNYVTVIASEATEYFDNSYVDDSGNFNGYTSYSYSSANLLCFASTEDGVNIRQSPSTESAILGAVPYCGAIHVVAEQGNWYYGEYYGIVGWVSKNYVSTSTNIGSSFTAIAITDDGVNLRTGPSTEYSIITTIPHNDTMYVLGKRSTWYYVRYDGMYGWVSQNYVSAY